MRYISRFLIFFSFAFLASVSIVPLIMSFLFNINSFLFHLFSFLIPVVFVIPRGIRFHLKTSVTFYIYYIPFHVDGNRLPGSFSFSVRKRTLDSIETFLSYCTAPFSSAFEFVLLVFTLTFDFSPVLLKIGQSCISDGFRLARTNTRTYLLVDVHFYF